MADIIWPNPSASPWTDPNGVIWDHNGIGWRKRTTSVLSHADLTARDTVDSHPAAAISGLSLPNMLFNADFLILDHGGGNRTPGINVYGFNRWRGSAIGLKQTVEGKSITSGNYTLSWGGGTGNGSLNGVEAISPITTVLASDVNADAEVPSDATWARLERGDAMSPHIRRDIGEDENKCQRYFWYLPGEAIYVPMLSSGLTFRSIDIIHQAVMRATPLVSIASVTNLETPDIASVRERTRISGNATTVSATSNFSGVEFDAEIYD